MRTWGMIVLIAGVAAFLYCSSRLSALDPVPPGVELGDYLSYEAGRWELGRYGGAVAGLLGVLLAMFPKGR